MTTQNRSSEGVAEMFTDCQSWLENQPGMKPLSQSQSELLKQLDQWLEEYSAQVCESIVANGHDSHGQYTDRLWGCWSHHWQQALETVPEKCMDGLVVAEQIRTGRGYRRGGRLGGDPLRDVVLAVAMTNKDGQAPVCFEQDYKNFSTGLAGKVHPHFKHDADDWWNEFLDALAGYTSPPGKLNRFRGKCALRNWLGTVLWNFLRRRRLPAGTSDAQFDEGDGQIDDSFEEFGSLECRNFFANLVQQALDELSEGDRLILKLLFADGLLLKQAAKILNIVPGNAGRRRDRAIGQLHDSLKMQAAKIDKQSAFQDCQDTIWEHEADFASELRSALLVNATEETV